MGSPVTQGWLFGMDASFREVELLGKGVCFILILTICYNTLFWVDQAPSSLLGQGKMISGLSQSESKQNHNEAAVGAPT